MRLINRLAAGRKSATFEQTPFWSQDLRLPFLDSGSWSVNQERVDTDFLGMVRTAYKRNGVIFALNLVRMTVFSQAEFAWQRRLDNGRWGDLYATDELEVLRKPWPGGRTSNLLARMMQDADLAGTAYNARRPAGIRRMNPAWVTTILGSHGEPLENQWDLDAEVIGYMYEPMGPGPATPAVLLKPDEVSAFAPIPDPEARFRGMSWISPIVRELEADNAATKHKLKFFEHGATPQIVVSVDRSIDIDKFKKFVEVSKAASAGVDNAYKTMYLGAGADATVVGKDLKQLDFRATQGAGETRMAAAANVPPVIAGFSEGLQAATYSNYGQARRRFADGTMHPAWGDAAGALAPLVKAPDRDRLWYDVRDVPFLRDDAKDQAEIQRAQASTIRQYTDSGWTAESARDAVAANDLTLLEHTGLFSVQLQPPNSAEPPTTVTDPKMAAALLSTGWKIAERGGA